MRANPDVALRGESLEIQIDPEFQALIPPLSESERAQLEENLRADGCRDPLAVWCPPAPSEHKCILIDGHNRYEICTRLNIDFDTVEIDGIKTRDEALDWIDANQLGRRNLSPDAFKLLLGRRYNRQKRQGARTDLTSDQIDPKLQTADKLATEYGVSPATVKRAGKFAEEVERTPALAQAIVENRPVLQAKREIKEEEREQRREENRVLIAQATDPVIASKTARFATITIDPPWDWGDEGDADQLGRARPTYGTMPFSDLLAMPVADMADDDAHIYLWITNRSLPKGFALLEKWGFRYITALTWCKPSIGMGNYFRGSSEQVLFGVKGSQPLKRKDVGTWFQAPRGPNGHSSKPAEFYPLVESCSPGPYLEMFARSDRIGWTAWGAESDGA